MWAYGGKDTLQSRTAPLWCWMAFWMCALVLLGEKQWSLSMYTYFSEYDSDVPAEDSFLSVVDLFQVCSLRVI